ncbi:MAG: SDR family oxidoreductase [Bacteroidia bacterium]|nr:SDR family oxidoreductase [Bacteroidia bacterium]
MVNYNSVVIISGTSRGIGKSLAEYYINKGYNVYGCSRSKGTIFSDHYIHQELDITDETKVIEWVRKIKRTGKRVDALICNAGIAPANVLLSLTTSDILENVIETNFYGTFFLCREVSKIMLQQKYGRIVTFSSMAESILEEGTSAYSASKSSIICITKILAKELAPYGITCNVIAPSVVPTTITESLGEKIIDKVVSKLSVNRPLTMEEICYAVNFFTSNENSFITGQVLYLGLVC